MTSSQPEEKEPYGLLIGFITGIGGTPNINKAYNSGLDVINTFQKHLFHHLSLLGNDNLSELDGFYKPIFFQLWGSFDIGFMCAIEDFDVLNSLHKISGVSIPQYLVGYLPTQPCDDAKLETVYIDPLKMLFNNGTLIQKLPLVGICQIKISGFIKLMSANSIKQDVLACLKKQITIYTKGKEEFIKVCLIETVNWNEFTVLILSNNYDNISGLVSLLRTPTLKDLINIRTEASYPPFPEYNAFFDYAINNENKYIHLFSATHTILGFDYNLTIKYNDDDIANSDKAKLLNAIKGNILPVSLFNIKPGHDYQCIKDCNNIFPSKLPRANKNKTIVFFGKSDIPIFPETLPVLVETKKFIKEYLQRLNAVSNSPGYTSPVYRTDTIIGVEVPLKRLPLEKHKSLNIHLHKLAFNENESELYDLFLQEICRLKVFSIKRRKIDQTISLFNSCIEDPIMFDAVLEIRPYIARVLQLFNSNIEKLDVASNLYAGYFLDNESIIKVAEDLSNKGICDFTNLEPCDIIKKLNVFIESPDSYEKIIPIVSEHREDEGISQLTKSIDTIESNITEKYSNKKDYIKAIFIKCRNRRALELATDNLIPPPLISFTGYKQSIGNLVDKFMVGLEFFEKALNVRLSASYRSFELNDFSSDGLGGMYAYLSAMDGYLKCQQTIFPEKDQAGFAFYSSRSGAYLSNALAPLIEFSAYKLIQLTGLLYVPHELFHYFIDMDQSPGLHDYHCLFHDIYTGVSQAKKRFERAYIADNPQNDNIAMLTVINKTDETAIDVLCDIYSLNSTFGEDFSLFKQLYWSLYTINDDILATTIDPYHIARFLVLSKLYDSDFSTRLEFFQQIDISAANSFPDNNTSKVALFFKSFLNDYCMLNNSLKITLTKFKTDDWFTVYGIFSHLNVYYGNIFDKLRYYTDRDNYFLSKNYYIGADGEDIAAKNLKTMVTGATISPESPETPFLEMNPRLFSNVLTRSFALWLFNPEEIGRNKRIQQEIISKGFSAKDLKDYSEVLIDDEGRIVPRTIKKRREFFLLRLSLINSLIGRGAWLKWCGLNNELRGNQ